jgi:hypothetical protein
MIETQEIAREKLHSRNYIVEGISSAAQAPGRQKQKKTPGQKCSRFCRVVQPWILPSVYFAGGRGIVFIGVDPALGMPSFAAGRACQANSKRRLAKAAGWRKL